MATAQELVTYAYRLIGALDISETAPDPSMAAVGITALQNMIEGWAASSSLNVLDQTITGTTTDDDPTITDLASTAKLAVGMNVSGTGVPNSGARILTIDSLTKVTLDVDCTASGSVSLTFVTLPFEAKYERGIEALLALELAPLIGEDNIPPIVQKMAADGWAALMANFAPVPDAVFDEGILSTTTTRRVSDA